MYPEMVVACKAFLEQHGTKANSRRRDTNETASNGVTLEALRDHIVSKVPELKHRPGAGEHGLSVATVHRMLNAPSKRSVNNARRFHGVVDAHVPGKNNSRRKETGGDTNHQCMSMMGYLCELAADQPDVVGLWSVDDKAKLRVCSRCPCVSRYHQLRRLFATGDEPVYYDHDFPTAGYLLVPSGYQKLDQQEWQRGVRYFDRHGRPHLPWNRQGPLHVVLRACKYQKSNAQAHANDLYKLLRVRGGDRRTEKPIVVVYADGGPDWATTSKFSFYFYGLLWMRLGLTAWIMGSAGGGYSAFNPIERTWAQLSKLLSGVYLSDLYRDDDAKPPQEKGGIEKATMEAEEHVVFDRASRKVCQHWNGNSIAGYPVTATRVRCAAAPEPFTNAELDAFTLWKKTTPTRLSRPNKLKAHLQKLGRADMYGKLRRITAVMKFLVRHCDRRSHLLAFAMCNDPGCEQCVKRGGRHPSTKAFFETVARHDNLFTPQPDPATPGHYKTYLGVKATTQNLHFVPNLLMDEEIARLHRARYGKPPDFPGRCPDGCKWAFVSKADHKRHQTFQFCKGSRRLARGGPSTRARAAGVAARKKANPGRVPRGSGRRCDCKFPGCNVTGMTRQQRAKHVHKPLPRRRKKARARMLPKDRTAKPPPRGAATAAGEAAGKKPVGKGDSNACCECNGGPVQHECGNCGRGLHNLCSLPSGVEEESDRRCGKCFRAADDDGSAADNDGSDDLDEEDLDEEDLDEEDLDEEDLDEEDEDAIEAEGHNKGACDQDVTHGANTRRTFVDNEHTKVVRLEVKEEGGNWRAAWVWRNNANTGAVLHFGDQEYEGIGGTYSYEGGVLRDADSDTVETRRLQWWHQRAGPPDRRGVGEAGSMGGQLWFVSCNG